MVILVGPSACGKTALGKFLETKGINKLVTYTSRPKRVGEVDGKDYHFITKEKFEKLIAEKFFYEYVLYQGNFYGTAKKDIDDNLYVILEPQGLKKYQGQNKVKAFFIECPKDVRLERMFKRGDESSSIMKRIATDDAIFNEDVKHSCYLVLDGTKDFLHNYKIIEDCLNGLQ